MARFLSLLCAALLLGPALQAADAPLKPVRFQLDWYPDAERGGFICALVNGYYKDAGLDVTILPAIPNVSPLGSMLAGKIDFFMWQSDQVTLTRSQGLPLVAVMATMQHDPQAVMVHDESPVKTFADLDGKTIAAIPASSWLPYIIKKFSLKNVREMRVTFGVANFLVDPNYIQQVFVTSEPYLCQQQGVKVRTLLIKDTGCDPYRVVVTSDNVVASDPAKVQAFVSASIKGWQTYLKDPVATDAEIKKLNPQITQGQLDFSRQALSDGHFVLGYPDKGEAMGKIDPARIASQYKILRDLQVLKSDFDFSKVYTEQFISPAPAK